MLLTAHCYYLTATIKFGRSQLAIAHPHFDIQKLNVMTIAHRSRLIYIYSIFRQSIMLKFQVLRKKYVFWQHNIFQSSADIGDVAPPGGHVQKHKKTIFSGNHKII